MTLERRHMDVETTLKRLNVVLTLYADWIVVLFSEKETKLPDDKHLKNKMFYWFIRICNRFAFCGHLILCFCNS